MEWRAGEARTRPSVHSGVSVHEELGTQLIAHIQEFATMQTVKEFSVEYLRRCAGYSDIGSRRSIIGHFVSCVGHFPLDSVRKTHIDIWIEDQLRFYKQTTVNGRCKYATRMMQEAVEDGFISTNPFNKVKRPRAETRGQYLSYSQEEAIIRNKPGWFVDAVVFSIETGVRQGELVNLMSSNLNIDDRILRLDVRETKGGKLARGSLKARSIPLTDRAITALGESCHKRRVGLLFRGPKGRLLRTSTLYDNFVRSTGFMSSKRPVWHDLRHTWATRVAMAGIDVSTLQAWAGWTSLAMAQRYTHIPEDHLRDSAAKLGELRIRSA